MEPIAIKSVAVFGDISVKGMSVQQVDVVGCRRYLGSECPYIPIICLGAHDTIERVGRARQ